MEFYPGNDYSLVSTKLVQLYNALILFEITPNVYIHIKAHAHKQTEPKPDELITVYIKQSFCYSCELKFLYVFLSLSRPLSLSLPVSQSFSTPPPPHSFIV